MQQDGHKLASRGGKIVITSLILVILGGLGWWQYDLQQRDQQEKFEAEQQRILRVMREAGVASQKAWATQGQASLNEDGENSQEINDQGELAQAKLWQSLPKTQRDAMRKEFTVPAEPSRTK